MVRTVVSVVGLLLYKEKFFLRLQIVVPFNFNLGAADYLAGCRGSERAGVGKTDTSSCFTQGGKRSWIILTPQYKTGVFNNN